MIRREGVITDKDICMIWGQKWDLHPEEILEENKE